MSKENYIFIYDNMRLNQNKYFILRNIGAEFFHKGTTKDNLLLLGNKTKKTPLLFDVNFGSGVKGEIFKISEKGLNYLDSLDENKQLVKRKQKNILYNDCLCKTNKLNTIECWIYIIDNKKAIEDVFSGLDNYFDIIESGDWNEYIKKID
jgi:gamma-glutamylcyclotransferase (GGCT)/AIG2-like uncharacterized protein YtfP